ncbi:MAG: signal recognition particle-docking protein FtsY [Proteobacteria bacterium]|nr:signal recognition particle-docking protein FtsY [Pseudomonadota bacterium]
MTLYLSLALVGLAGVVAGIVLKKKKSLSAPKIAEPQKPEAQATPTSDSLEGRLSKTRSFFSGRLGQILQASGSEAGTASDWDAVEELLIEGDVGVTTTQLLIEKVKSRLIGEKTENIKSLLRLEMENLFAIPHKEIEELFRLHHPLVISVVGVNGAGKTTTIGKLASQFKQQGKTVLLGAGDTFRAGAIAQLKMWAERVGAEFVTGREGADPGAVAFDSVSAAKAREIDVVLLDTAGRLHTKTSLMEELKKIQRVVKKVIPDAPHEIWLVLDGTLGQNSLNQAREFQKALGVTGIIVTKLDGTAKGGALLPVTHELLLPVRYIGVGEGVEDLLSFNSKKFVAAIFD